MNDQPDAPAPRPQKGLLTRKEAAEYLGVCEQTLKRLEGRRRFPRFKDGKLVRYRRAVLDRYIDSRTKEKR